MDAEGQTKQEVSGAKPKAPHEVRFSHEGKETILKVDEFNALFGDIERFNRKFSTGSIMARSIFSLYEGPEEDSLSTYDEKAQELTAAGINLIHRNTLNKVGLEIEPVSGKYARLIAADKQIGAGEMRLNIKDRRRFLGFLQVLDLTITKDSPLGEHLDGLSHILAQQILDHYNLQQPSDEALQLLGSLEGIVREFRRLEVRGSKRLKTYLEHSKTGDLREYILVEQEGLLTEPGEYFGPADWQKDIRPEGLKERWGVALKALETAKKNPNAQKLYHQLYEHLRKSLEIAIENLEVLEREGYPKEYISGLRPILEGVKRGFT